MCSKRNVKRNRPRATPFFCPPACRSHTRYKPWPKVEEFLCGLQPCSLVADAGCGNGKRNSFLRNTNNVLGNGRQRACGSCAMCSGAVVLGGGLQQRPIFMCDSACPSGGVFEEACLSCGHGTAGSVCPSRYFERHWGVRKTGFLPRGPGGLHRFQAATEKRIAVVVQYRRYRYTAKRFYFGERPPQNGSRFLLMSTYAYVCIETRRM